MLSPRSPARVSDRLQPANIRALCLTNKYRFAREVIPASCSGGHVAFRTRGQYAVHPWIETEELGTGYHCDLPRKMRQRIS